MIALTLAASLAAQSADTVQGPRAAFDRCLEQRIEAAKAQGQPSSEFRAAIRTACAAEAAAFRTALIAYDVSTGQSQAEAARWADEDISDHRDAAARRYDR